MMCGRARPRARSGSQDPVAGCCTRRPYGHAQQLYDQRAQVLAGAYARYPDRFVRKVPSWQNVTLGHTATSKVTLWLAVSQNVTLAITVCTNVTLFPQATPGLEPGPSVTGREARVEVLWG
jgi:hypothetical protein